MKKRLKKKLAKKNGDSKQYGVIVNNDLPVHHGFKIGEVVKVMGVSRFGNEFIECVREPDGLDQTIHVDQIKFGVK